MTKHIIGLRNRAQALGLRVYADAGAKAILDELHKAFHDFKQENDTRLSELEKGREDVVTNEKVDRINAAVSESQGLLNKLTSEIDRMNAEIARGGMGGGGDISPERTEHKTAFESFFRRGIDNGLSKLEIHAALTTQSDPDGGYVVPAEFDVAIDRVLGEMGAMRSLARIQPIGSATYKKLVNKAGAGGGWVGEEEQRSDTSNPQLAQLAFEAMEMYAEPSATQTLLEDAYLNIETWLADEVSETFIDLEAAAFMNGSGSKEPRGLLAYDKIANGSWAWGKIGYVHTGVSGAFGAKPIDNMIDVQTALHRKFRKNAAWMMNTNTEATLRKVKDTQNNYIWQPSIKEGTPAILLGKRVEIDDFMPNVGAGKFPVAYGDFHRGYIIVDRRGTQVLRDPLTSKGFVKFYTTRRVGGGVQNYQAIKLLKVATS